VSFGIIDVEPFDSATIEFVLVKRQLKTLTKG